MELKAFSDLFLVYNQIILRIKNVKDMIYAAKLIKKLGAKNVLIKGGHLKNKVVKIIVSNKIKIIAIISYGGY